MSKKEKTNVGRILDAKKVEYNIYTYDGTGTENGEQIAEMLKENPARVFKTLVTVGKSRKNYVFVIPVACELDLKKAAAAVGEKNIEMIALKELLPLTGYIHGGCSPIGMKKAFPTVFDKTVNDFDTVFFSAGKIGFQVELKPSDAKDIIGFSVADITV